MSYTGYTKTICKNLLSHIKNPKILEIGIDLGQTSFPLIHNLSHISNEFTYIGIDIHIKDHFINSLIQFIDIELMAVCRGPEATKATIVTEYINKPNSKNIILYEENSLFWLKEKNLEIEFDAVFIDGDHNYFTVLKELQLLKPFLKSTSIIVCDDYFGKWSERDLYYADREGYESNLLATSNKYKLIDKQGVKTAVDDFLLQEPYGKWGIIIAPEIEPAILYKQDAFETPAHARNFLIDFPLKFKKLDK